jgi:peptide/nickel transport system substrate-binding protein
MSDARIDDLVDRFRSGSVDRRTFIRRATALGVGPIAAAALARQATAHQSTPEASHQEHGAASPVASAGATPAGEVIRSMTRAEYYEQLKSHFQLEDAAETGGTFIYTDTSDISTLNPILVSDVPSGIVVGFVFEGLTGGSTIDGTTVPSGIADYWEIGADGVTYTFHLNPQATWHDGTPVTAYDCEFTFDAVLAEDSLSFRKGTVEAALKSYRAIDERTFELVSLEQSAVFLDDTTNQFAILPKHIWENVPFAEWGADPGSNGQDPARVVGSGPFTFVERELGSQIRLARNADYWDQEHTPYIDEFVFRIVADENSAVASLQTGETDLTSVPSSLVESVSESNPELQIASYDTAAFTYYMVNQDPALSSLFLDVGVRQALHYALDRVTYAQTIENGYSIRADGTQPVLSPAYAPDQINTIYAYDPEKANSLLEEAGWTMGDDGIREKDGQRFSFECIYPEGVATYAQGIPFMQQYWREVGVEMIPAAVPFPTLLERIDTFQFEMAVLGFSWDFSGLQSVMLRCDMVPFNGFNNMKYCNERYDELDSAARRELDPDARRDLMIEAANIVNDEMAIGVITFGKGISGARPEVRNYLPNGYSGLWWVQYTWLEQES